MVIWVIESPRYLYSCEEYDKCDKAIEEIALFNKVLLPPDFTTRPQAYFGNASLSEISTSDEQKSEQRTMN